MRKSVISLILIALIAADVPDLGAAQQPAVPEAKAEDVASVDAIIRAVYDVISGPAGQKRDWNRFRSLFAPGARLVPTGRDQSGTGRMRVWTPEEYATQAGANLESSGFFERELGRTSERYGNIVQAFSTYDSKRSLSDEKPFMRGINSFQVWNDGKRWWIVSIFWEGETPGNPIPEKYLKFNTGSP